jgi:hypothetical protein
MAKDKPRTSTRTAALTIRLDPKIVEGLTELSEKLGIATSTLAGLAIGEYVVKSQATYINPQIMMQACGTELAKQIAAPLTSVFEGKSKEELIGLFSGD